ncbi:GNAT family N-acetyltransferase [Streptomyces sp. UNOC14_S4]|uniref:GNAT family N-acetyltransferase n=1 Tax=Streptomyces sp. UNOC14_S4 TaxID=2872340 RepID=UPI001E427243|nr:GNAT family N-acetyltransferase [Streptomyces sp. UNOC14_S4]MCC3766885.1 GNAT family N-acetyltransferase [Streptomyces sp. UNOC14_S4]
MTDTTKLVGGIALRHTVAIEPVWSTLIEVYAEVRADQLRRPHYSVERYGERLARHAQDPGWEAVIGYDGDEPVGYAYVNTLEPDDRWWRRMTTPLPEGCASTPTVALKEIMLREAWRKTGTARRIHDELLARRPEKRVSLLVNPEAGDGKVLALYESWGYEKISEQQPSPDGPILTAMLRDIR